MRQEFFDRTRIDRESVGKRGRTMENDVIASPTTDTIHGVSGFEQQVGPGLKDLAKLAEKLGRLKKIGGQVTVMNLMDLRKQLEEVARLSFEAQTLAEEVSGKLPRYVVAAESVDQTEWFERFRTAFHSGYPPVEGEFPTFQVFPVEVRVDFANELVMINNRTVRALHPEAVAALVEKEWDRLNRERFNAASFAKALVRAYDLLLLELRDKVGGREPGRAIPLRALHQTLALKSGVSGYSLNQFAFDVYRLRRSPHMVVEGRRLDFGTSRDRGIVITHPGGRQEKLGALELIPEDHAL